MDGIQVLASTVSGGLAGAVVSSLSNRWFHWRTLRTKFFPIVQDFWGEYLLRFQTPEGRWWVTTVGYVPSPEDEKFVTHRTQFIDRLVEFNELKEARELRKHLISSLNPDNLGMGEVLKTDLQREYDAVHACFMKLHKKLRLW